MNTTTTKVTTVFYQVMKHDPAVIMAIVDTVLSTISIRKEATRKITNQ